LSTATITKCVEAGIDNVDTAISSMAMTYGHSATESVVSIFHGRERDTGLDIGKLENIAGYFREVRKKYHQFEGSLRGVDSRILVAQVPGGMLTNMEGQLKEQGAGDRLDEVLEEIPRVREDLGFIPLVTPTSQIVGTQAVLNVLTGERYNRSVKRLPVSCAVSMARHQLTSTVHCRRECSNPANNPSPVGQPIVSSRRWMLCVTN
jgi:oxaloacetate decarboxylase alpha subunit